MKDIEFLYVVDVRTVVDGEKGWRREELMATSIFEVTRLLKRKLDDVRFVTKSRVY